MLLLLEGLYIYAHIFAPIFTRYTFPSVYLSLLFLSVLRSFFLPDSHRHPTTLFLLYFFDFYSPITARKIYIYKHEPHIRRTRSPIHAFSTLRPSQTAYFKYARITLTLEWYTRNVIVNVRLMLMLSYCVP